MTPSRVALIVDSQFLIVELLSTMLRDMGINVCGSAATADQAIVLAETHSPELVLMEMRLDGRGDGLEAAKAIRRATGAAIIFVTGWVELAASVRIVRGHPAAVLHKPVRFDQLRRAVLHALS